MKGIARQAVGVVDRRQLLGAAAILAAAGELGLSRTANAQPAATHPESASGGKAFGLPKQATPAC